MSGEVNLETLANAYHLRFATVEGIGKTLIGEPSTVEHLMIYTVFDDTDYDETLYEYADTVHLLHRVIFVVHDPEVTEQEVYRLARTLAIAVRQDPTLGGAVSSGMARITNARGVWVEFGDVRYRALDVRSETVLEPADGWQEEE